MLFFKQMSLIYWVRNTKTDAELVLLKHDILSRLKESKDLWLGAKVNY